MTATHATTLSPAAAILWAYRFAEDGTAEAIPQGEVDAALAMRGGWFWIHAGLADARCRIWLEQHAPISPAARDILIGPNEHLHLDVTNNEIAGVLPDLRRDLAQASMDFARFRFVMTARMLISARRHPLHAIELTRRSIEGGGFPPPYRCSTASSAISPTPSDGWPSTWATSSTWWRSAFCARI
jgi:zinc transporter